MKRLLKNYNFILSMVCFLFAFLFSICSFSTYSFEENKKIYCISLFSVAFFEFYGRFVDYFRNFLDDVKDYRKEKEAIKEYEENA